MKTITQKYPYESIPNDPNQVRIYTLENGLKVYLAQNFDAPKIQTYIPVRTGSNNDPADNTGLSHYLEHMLFKGTSQLGTQNWEKEKPLLDEISDLFEQHKAEQNPEKKKEIYRKIDEVSQKASEYAIANEYDKAISSLGATGTNAHTWFDETVYKNNIPSNELEKWLKIESNRFSDLVLRLFHTELESVYEEFNKIQDNDQRLVQYELMHALFPTHPNGQQTTIGKAEHLKNPSMKAIHAYFDAFYVPNNMAIVMVGDLEFEPTIRLVDQYFGKLKFKPLPPKKEILEKPMDTIVKRTLQSPTIARLQLAWRSDSYGTHEARIIDIIAQLLSNQADTGILDEQINQQQKALRAGAYSFALKKYGYISMIIVPNESQSLDDAKNLLLAQIEEIKKGNFDDWKISAIVNDMKIQRLKQWETADGLATHLYESFIKERNWIDELKEIERYQSITKEEVVNFAQEFFKDNYVAIYKEQGENQQLIRVENPKITPIKINREAQSDFLREILSIPSEDIAPKFVDYNKIIQTELISHKKVHFIENQYHDIAQVHFIFPFGSDHFKELPLAIDVLQYLGTEKLTAVSLKNEFFKIGVSHDFLTTADQLKITLTGLEENILKGIEILKEWLKNIKPDEEIYQKNVQQILESRIAAKQDKNRIMIALVNYAKFGKNSRFRNNISEQELRELSSEKLTNLVKQIWNYPYEIFFYGKDFSNFQEEIKKYIEKETQIIPEPSIFPEPDTQGKVYFAHYDMVQAEMTKVGKAQKVNTDNFGKINVFNEYFGRGLSSIVFQELRESQSLAYSATVSYNANAIQNKHDYVTTYIGTQPDKLQQAIESIQKLMGKLPQIENQFQNARKNVLKQLATGRVTRTNLFFNFKNLEKLGIDYDLREKMYQEIETLTLEDLTQFYRKEIRPVEFNTAIIGHRDTIDFTTLKSLGEVEEVSLEE